MTYVEEGAQNIIPYHEVNAAQQVWCDALVEIGKIKESGCDYKTYTKKAFSIPYNYDFRKVF